MNGNVVNFPGMNVVIDRSPKDILEKCLEGADGLEAVYVFWVDENGETDFDMTGMQTHHICTIAADVMDLANVAIQHHSEEKE